MEDEGRVDAGVVSDLKRWTVGSLLRSDLLERGLPWTVLLWRESRARRTTEPLFATGDLLRLPDPALARRPFLLDLNLQTSNRVSVALAALLALNWQLYRFLAQRRGRAFTLAAIPWHWLYYFYNNLSFGVGTLLYFMRGVRPVAADGALPAPTELGQAEADHAHPAPDA